MSAPTNTVKHTPDATDSIADDLLRNGYERWLRLEEEKAAIGDDLKELFAELKGQGFTPKALRESFRRVRNADSADQQEHDAIVDLYVASLTRARPARTREASYSEAKGIDRDARRKQRMSESMDDAKALSAEAAAHGLIDPAAHAETVRLSDAIANKYGAGVIDPETGELTDNQESGTAGSCNTSPISQAADESETDDVGATASSTNPHSPDDLLPVEADTAGGVAPPAPPATLSDPYDPGEIPAFLRREGGYSKREAEAV